MEYDAIIARVEGDPSYDDQTREAMVRHLQTLRREEAFSRLNSSKAKVARDALRLKYNFNVSRFRPANRSV
jgi:hypothetical protein